MKNKSASKNQRNESKIIYKKLLKSTKPIKGGLILASFFSAFNIALMIITPILLRDITNEIYNYWDLKTSGLNATMNLPLIQKLSWILVVLYGFAALFMLGKIYVNTNTVSRHYTCQTRINLSDKLLRLPISYVDSTTNGDFISRMTNDVSIMGNTVHSVLDLFIQGFLQVLAIAGIMFYINWVMALIILTVVPVSIVVSSIVAKRGQKYFVKMQQENGELNTIIEESYSNVLLIKAYNNENAQEKRHGKKANDIKNLIKNGFFYSLIVEPIINYTNNIAYIVVCALGGYFTIKGWLDVGGLLSIIIYAKMLSQPLSGIASSFGQLQHTFAASKRVFEIMDKDEMKEVDCGKEFAHNGNVTFENVDFSYKKDEPLIQNLNINVKSGQKVAIVGPTGAGKTTIVNLLMRFYDVDKGKILIDGVDIMKMPRDKVRQEFAMVLQDTWLFNGTIYDNVAYGKDDATYEEVIKACENSYADHFIRTLPDGYNMVINDDNNNLSGGQKQLLTIARAFLADKKMLILDEATSNVDTRTEVLIQKAMKKLMEGRTCFVIAHRLSTIIDSDLILVIDKGNIVEQGNHKELLKKDGLYARIYNSQYALVK